MKATMPARLLAVLLAFIATSGAAAQDATESDAPAAPDFQALQSDWWSFFEGPPADLEPRIDDYLDDVGVQIAELAPQNQEIAQAILDAVRDNLTALLALLEEAELTTRELEPAAVSYSIDDLLALAATARDARSAAAAEQLEVNREQRVLDGTSRHRDAVFNDYVDAAEGDERWLAALRLLQARSAQAIATRRLQLLTESYERASAYAEATAGAADLAVERLVGSADQTVVSELVERVEANVAAVESARETLRAAQIAASGLDLDTAQGRSQQRLQQQRLLGAEVGLALDEMALAQSEAHRWWAELVADTGPDTSTLEDQALDWSELVRDVEQQAPDWKRETEDELIAVQSVDRDGLNRASRRLLDQRLGTAQETLARVGELEAAIDDLELLTLVVDNTAAEYTGAFKSWLAGISRALKTAYLRVAGLADVTLFEVGGGTGNGRRYPASPGHTDAGLVAFASHSACHRARRGQRVERYAGVFVYRGTADALHHHHTRGCHRAVLDRAPFR